MNPLNRPGAQQISGNDLEKRGELKASEVNVTTNATKTPSLGSADQHDIPPTPVLFKGKLGEWNAKIERLAGLEARGITRVLPEEKHGGGRRGYLQMFALWSSINLTVTNIITGLLGPLVFSLGWKDCVCIVIFAQAVAACGPSFTSIFGPQSGNRTMVVSRFFMGYWPTKLVVILNLIMQIGWGIIGCIIAGQFISAVSGDGLSIAVGCVISALSIGFVAAFGIAILQTYERYAFIPQLVAIFVLIGSAGRNFDVHAVSVGPAGTVTAHRCSFFALEFASIIGFTAIAADFYVYYPTNSSKPLTFLATWAGTWIPLVFFNLIGVGVATGVANNPSWNDAYDISAGALLYETYNGLGGFGGLCVVILALGSITNNVPGSYAAALNFQVLGRYGKAVPRWIWCLIVMIIELVCSVAGRNHLFNVFQNFLPLMAYWVCPWVTIFVEEHFLFRKLRCMGYDWNAWEDKKRLPVGAAALLSFLIGWAGAITGMYQIWYQGPVAAKVAGDGADIGEWLAISFTAITYPPVRYLELKKYGR